MVYVYHTGGGEFQNKKIDLQNPRSVSNQTTKNEEQTHTESRSPKSKICKQSNYQE
jgi:hypothetical protein